MASATTVDGDGCQMDDVVHLLSKAHVLALLRLFIVDPDEPKRYHQIQSRLSVSSSTLSIRLEELVEAGFLTRTAYEEIPPRVEYTPTRKTSELDEVFQAIHDWSDRHDVPPIDE